MAKKSICSICGVLHENDMRCTCQPVDIIAKAIPEERLTILARPVLAAVRAAFEDPIIAAEFELWKQKRKSNLATR